MTDKFKRRMQRVQELYEQLLESPTVLLTGILVDFGAGKSGEQTDWTFFLSFDVWRIDNGPIRKEPIEVRRKVAHKDMINLSRKFDRETVFRVRARIIEDDDFGVIALLDEYIAEAHDDAELRVRLAEYLEAITLQDDQLGTFKFERHLNGFIGSLSWQGQAVSLLLMEDRKERLKSCLKIARSLRSDLEEWTSRMADFAAQDLLPIEKFVSLGENKGRLLPGELKGQPKLKSILIHSDRDFEFQFEVRDNLTSQTFGVWGNLKDGPTFAGFPM